MGNPLIGFGAMAESSTPTTLAGYLPQRWLHTSGALLWEAVAPSVGGVARAELGPVRMVAVVHPRGASLDAKRACERARRYVGDSEALLRPLVLETMAWSEFESADFLPKPVPASGLGLDPHDAPQTRVSVLGYAQPESVPLDELADEALTPELLGQIIVGIEAAIGELHDQGFSHGHLRPELVFFSHTRGVFVAGLEVEALLRDLGAGSANAGALPRRYCAPERRNWGAGRATKESDAYALSAIADALLERTQIVRTPEIVALFEAGLNRLPQARPQDLQSYSREFQQALLRALALSAEAAAPVEQVPSTALQAGAIGQVPSKSLPSEGLQASVIEQAPSEAEQASAIEQASSEAVQGSSTAMQASSEAVQAAAIEQASNALQAAPLTSGQVMAFDPPSEVVGAERRERRSAALRQLTESTPRPDPTPNIGNRQLERRRSWGVTLAISFGILLMVFGVGSVSLFSVLKGRNAPLPKAPSIPISASAAPKPPDAGVPPVPAPNLPPTGSPPTQSPSSESPSGESPPAHLPKLRALPQSGLALLKAMAGLSRDTAGTSGKPEPNDARAPVPIGPDTPTWGTPDSLVTVVVFGDLECVHTRRMLRELFALKVAMPRDLRLSFHHRPVSGHAHAKSAAIASASVFGQHGTTAFWALLIELSRDDTAPAPMHLTELTARLGLPPKSPGDKAALARAEKLVESDQALAERLGIRTTPTLFINGQELAGEVSIQELSDQVLFERQMALSLLLSGEPQRSLYAARTRKNFVNLGVEPTLRSCVPKNDAPWMGSSEPILTIVEFSDFECEHCRAGHEQVRRFVARHPKDVGLSFRNLPLPQHPRAPFLANFMREAFERKGPAKFFELASGVFRGYPELSDAHLAHLAESAGLQPEPLLKAAGSKAHESKIDADIRLAERLGVQGIPSYFLNGRLVEGVPELGALTRVLREERQGMRSLMAGGIERSKLWSVFCEAE